jgi:hypothetical protein
MYPRTNYEMSEEDLNKILEAPSANRAWMSLGEKMGFDFLTVRFISGKGQRFFSAVPEKNEIKKILASYIQQDGSLSSNDDSYLDWNFGAEKITLDGRFTADELEAIAWWMKRKSEV